jgi:hypothetical protein
MFAPGFNSNIRRPLCDAASIARQSGSVVSEKTSSPSAQAQAAGRLGQRRREHLGRSTEQACSP